ncbi:MAG: DUF1598 domain-containing protein [Planctomycetota bacterium]|nr:DUF1598 domain-containing protein [Planctomycetota bacterium]
MLFFSSVRPVCAGAILTLVLCTAFQPVPSVAQGTDLAEAIRAHLAAGEFGLAQDLAGTANSPRQRDVLSRPIVAAQAAAGMFRASLGSASAIQSDSERASAFGELMRMPIGSSGARGGAALADFDTLIDLITSTIKPDSWDEVGGPGAIEEFPTGVFVDASGLLKRVAIDDSTVGSLTAAREKAKAASEPRDIRRTSALRKVSLTKLERELQALWAAGRKPDAAMLNLAGLQRVKYVFVYPDSRDVVIAGPACDWTTDTEGRSVSTTDGSPILQLEDFVVALRNTYDSGGRFGCAITPTKENLAAVQSYLSESAKRSLKPQERDDWLNGLRSRLGRQDISVFGIDARTRTAQVLVEADYRMKLVGMGLEPGTLGVTSYLDSIKVPEGDSPPATAVLRWWFTLNYEAVRTTKAGDAFSIHGTGVKVLSENELLTERGERVHTGESDALNSQFAHSFTKHFVDLATKYPIYADLRNVFDLALVAAVLKSQDLPAQVDWEMSHLLDESRYRLKLGLAPRTVETVMNHRIIDRKHIVVGVSGGVSVDTQNLLQVRPIKQDANGQLDGDRRNAAPSKADGRWWWD